VLRIIHASQSILSNGLRQMTHTSVARFGLFERSVGSVSHHDHRSAPQFCEIAEGLENGPFGVNRVVAATGASTSRGNAVWTFRQELAAVIIQVRHVKARVVRTTAFGAGVFGPFVFHCCNCCVVLFFLQGLDVIIFS